MEAASDHLDHSGRDHLRTAHGVHVHEGLHHGPSGVSGVVLIMIDNIISGGALALTGQALFFSFLGTFAGVSVGAIPGLSGAMLIALILPVTFYMDPLNALTLIVGIDVGAVSGGLISATLLPGPGTLSCPVTPFRGS